jgi:hypothetical protein
MFHIAQFVLCFISYAEEIVERREKLSPLISGRKPKIRIEEQRAEEQIETVFAHTPGKLWLRRNGPFAALVILWPPLPSGTVKMCFRRLFCLATWE